MEVNLILPLSSVSSPCALFLFQTTFHGAVDHSLLTEYRVFVNPSLSEVLCTTIVEVLQIYPILPCSALPSLFLPCTTLLCPSIPCSSLPSLFLPCTTLLCPTLLCSTLPFPYATLPYSTLPIYLSVTPPLELSDTHTIFLSISLLFPSHSWTGPRNGQMGCLREAPLKRVLRTIPELSYIP